MNDGVFNIILVVSSLFIISFSITTCIDYNRLKRTLPPVFTLGDVNAMIVINAVMAGLALIIFGMAIYNIVIMKKKNRTEQNKQYYQNSVFTGQNVGG